MCCWFVWALFVLIWFYASLVWISLLQEHLIGNASLSSIFCLKEVMFREWQNCLHSHNGQKEITEKTEHEYFDVLTICSGEVISLGP